MPTALIVSLLSSRSAGFTREISKTILVIVAANGAAILLWPPSPWSWHSLFTGPIVIVMGSTALLIVLVGIERMVQNAGERKGIMSLLAHLRISIFLGLIGGLAATAAELSFQWLVKHFHLQAGLIDLRFLKSADFGLGGALAATWCYFCIMDLLYYWLHRAQHHIPMLWAHHKLHHLDRNLDAVTMGRDNWFESVLTGLFMILPADFLFNFDAVDPWALGIGGGVLVTAFQTVAMMGHMNVRLGSGRLGWFWCSPQMHRIHHSRLMCHQDRNFAFVLPLWDVLFGTYYRPAPGEYPPTGIDGEPDVTGLRRTQVYTQLAWWRMFKKSIQ